MKNINELRFIDKDDLGHSGIKLHKTSKVELIPKLKITKEDKHLIATRMYISNDGILY